MIAIRDTAGDVGERYALAAVPDAVEGAFEPPSTSLADFAAYCRHEFEATIADWELRAPAAQVDGLIPGLGNGSGCLEPLLPGRSAARAYFDPGLAARDGDLVLVRVREGFLQRMAEAGASDAAWSAANAPDGWLPNLWVKLLRHGPGGHWLLSRDVAVPLDVAGELLGVCRHIEIDGRPAYGSTPPASRKLASQPNWRRIARIAMLSSLCAALSMIAGFAYALLRLAP